MWSFPRGRDVESGRNLKLAAKEELVMSIGNIIFAVAVVAVVAVLFFGRKKVMDWINDKLTIWRK